MVEPVTPREKERWGRVVGGPLGVVGCAGQLPVAPPPPPPPPCAKPATGTTASIHIQMLPGGRSKEAIDGGMEGWRGEGRGEVERGWGGALTQ